MIREEKGAIKALYERYDSSQLEGFTEGPFLAAKSTLNIDLLNAPTQGTIHKPCKLHQIIADPLSTKHSTGPN